MIEITTESEWLTCDQPRLLGYAASGRIEPQRFRWLAADWVGRIRHLLEDYDVPWCDALVAWVAGQGPHPGEICWKPTYGSLCTHIDARDWAQFSGRSLRDCDWLQAAAYAGESLSRENRLPRFVLPKPDARHAHHGRSAKARAVREDQRQTLIAARKPLAVAQDKHHCELRQEFCDQFRDVAGNPFRPMVVRPEWRTPAVVELAQSIHADRSFDRMPQLADALADAGCDDEQVLLHGLGPTLHVRGCWLIDALAGDIL